MITRDRESGIPAVPGKDAVQPEIIKTIDQACGLIYDFELPVVTLPGFSLEPDGNIVWESDPNSDAELRLNESIKDSLKVVATLVAIPTESSSRFEKGIVEIEAKALDALSYAQDSVGHTKADREVTQIWYDSEDPNERRKQQESRDEQLRQQGVNGVTVPFHTKEEADAFENLLIKEGTKYNHAPVTDNSPYGVIVWFGEAYPISVIIKTS